MGAFARNVSTSTILNLLLLAYVVFGPVGFEWQLAHRDPCAIIGMAPLQGPVLLLTLAALVLVLGKKLRAIPSAFGFALATWLLLAVVEAGYWLFYASLPSASKC